MQIKADLNLKHFLNYLSSSVFLKLLSLLLIPFLLNILGSEEYGKLVLFQSYLGFATILVTLNTGSAVGRYCYEQQDDTYNFIGNTFIINLLCFFIISSVVLLNADYLSDFFHANIYFIMFLLVLGFFKSLISIYYQILIPLKLSKEYSRITFIEGAGTLIFTILISSYLVYNKYYGGFYSILIVSVVLLCYIIYKLKPKISFKPIKAHYKYILLFSIPQIPNLLSGVIIEQVSKIIIGLNGNYVNVGKFNILAQVASVLLFVSGSLRSTFLPEFYVALKEGNNETIKKGTRINFYITSGIAILLILFSEEILYIIAGNRYLSYHYALGWFVLPLVIYDLFLINSLIIEYKKKMGYISAIAIIGGLATIIFSSVIYHKFGFKYVVFSSALGYLVMYGISALVIKFIFKSSINVFKYSYDIIFPLIATILIINLGYFYFINSYLNYSIFRIVLLLIILLFYRKEIFKSITYFRG